MLLSSLFVYNQMGGIDEAALDRLSLVTEMTKHIRVRAGSSAGAARRGARARCGPARREPCASRELLAPARARPRQPPRCCTRPRARPRALTLPLLPLPLPAAGDELREFTPSFMWLLRDFYLQLEEEGRKITPR